MRGLKRKLPLEKIENKAARLVAFSKRLKGLHSKACKYCLLSDSQAAILTTPPSSGSHVSFYSFGHSSVDILVKAFLAGQRPPPPEDGFWWEDEELHNSEDPKELRDAEDAMTKLLHNLRMAVDKKRRDREDVKGKKKKKKRKNVLDSTPQKQTLNLQPSSSASLCNEDENSEGFNKNTEEQVLAICDKSSNGELGNLDGCGDELEAQVMNVETNQNPFSDSEAVKGGELVVHRDFYENSLHLPDLDDDQFQATSDSNNNKNDVLPGNLGEFDQELDLAEMSDFDTDCESLSMNLEKMDGDAV